MEQRIRTQFRQWSRFLPLLRPTAPTPRTNAEEPAPCTIELASLARTRDLGPVPDAIAAPTRYAVASGTSPGSRGDEQERIRAGLAAVAARTPSIEISAKVPGTHGPVVNSTRPCRTGSVGRARPAARAPTSEPPTGWPGRVTHTPPPTRSRPCGRWCGTRCGPRAGRSRRTGTPMSPDRHGSSGRCDGTASTVGRCTPGRRTPSTYTRGTPARFSLSATYRPGWWKPHARSRVRWSLRCRTRPRIPVRSSRATARPVLPRPSPGRCPHAVVTMPLETMRLETVWLETVCLETVWSMSAVCRASVRERFLSSRSADSAPSA